MNMNEKTKKIICVVLAVALCLPLALGIISMFSI